MCMFDDLAAPLSPTKPVVIEYEVHICKKEEYIKVDSMSAKSSSETLCSPPAYEEKPHSVVTVSAPRTKNKFFARIFKRNSKRTAHNATELPSYREAEVTEAWAKVGIDVNDRKHGPRPQCTPEELLLAMDGLFGAPTVARSA